MSLYASCTDDLRAVAELGRGHDRVCKLFALVAASPRAGDRSKRAAAPGLIAPIAACAAEASVSVGTTVRSLSWEYASRTRANYSAITILPDLLSPALMVSSAQPMRAPEFPPGCLLPSSASA